MRLRLPVLIQPSARRDWVTPEDVNVSPALLGHALARPAQRAWAMALDLALIGMASSLGNWLLLGSLALAAWLQIRRRDAQRPPSGFWWLLVALLLALGLSGLWLDLRESMRDSPRTSRPALTEPAEEAGDEDETRKDAVAAAPPTSASSASSAESRRIAELEAQVRRLRRSEEAARAHSGFQPRQWLDEALGEVGLRFSLAIVYFTLLPVLWPGQTVGKRLMGLKIAELSGKPMSLMRSFSRYGGYLASMGTGGMGFVQLVWDANRQALQDKAAHTVVLDLRRKDRLPITDDGNPAAPADTHMPTDPRIEPAP
ncbi:RDD family protein [Roseateles sp. DB2]|uniref:RDD family protein n=1 Tax=Roseateles sp. DB2 TaxID=3453717 RepID=UPI003EF03954